MLITINGLVVGTITETNHTVTELEQAGFTILVKNA